MKRPAPARLWRPSQTLPLLALLFLPVLAGACDTPTLLTVFTDLTYTQNGDAVVLNATDGLYVAAPPEDTPHRLGSSKKGCEGDLQYTLGCTRLSEDGASLAVLRSPKTSAQGEAGSAVLWDLWLFDLSRGDRDGKIVARGVTDAAFSPDGSELLWTAPNGSGGTSLFRRDGSGAPETLVASLTSAEGDSLGEAMASVVLTSAGAAYVQEGFSGLSLWFRPFAPREARELGVVSEMCRGNGLAGCHALSRDGVTFAWQEDKSGILQIYRSDADQRIPLGSGTSFRFSKAGGLLLRYSGKSLFIHRADTGAVVRKIDSVSSGQLSGDGETVAYLSIESISLGTGTLVIGPSRQSGRDSTIAAFAPPESPALWVSAAGRTSLPFTFTGDGRYVIASVSDAQGTPEGSSALVSVDTETGETRSFGSPSCLRCCQAASSGRLVVCTPPMPASGTDPLTTTAALEVHDPAAGRSVRGTESVLAWQASANGTSIVFTDYSQGTPELKTISASGETASLGTGYRFALSPVEDQVAYVNSRGKLSVTHLP